MSTLTFSAYLIRCDGCGHVFGLPDGHESGIEARAAAFTEGWRFPPQLTVTGKPGREVSDVCKNCVPGWQPRTANEKKTGGPLSIGELAELRGYSRASHP